MITNELPKSKKCRDCGTEVEKRYVVDRCPKCCLAAETPRSQAMRKNRV
jgi:predicted RNA-binding Zn-ribbon protein involved in translation (DUF1610 family)